MVKRLRECPFDRIEFLRETGLDPEEGGQWFIDNKDQIESVSAWTELDEGLSSVVFRLNTVKGKCLGVRVLFEDGEAPARLWLDELPDRSGLTIELVESAAG